MKAAISKENILISSIFFSPFTEKPPWVYHVILTYCQKSVS